MTIEINLFWLIIALVITIFLFLLHNFGGIKLFVNKDVHVADKFLDKFPLVAPDFYKKSTIQQNVENNQEIHELNKRIEAIEEAIRIHARALTERNNG